MEIKLDAAGEGSPPSDVFISMRVGDVQKQARFGGSKTFRFANIPNDRAGFGRVEVFKRVGHMTVSLSQKAGCMDIEVPCTGDLKSLSLRLGINGAPKLEAEEGSVNVEKSRQKARIFAAQQYLELHHLEEQLAEAMREVICNRPEHPYKFLSEYMLKCEAMEAPVASKLEAAAPTLEAVALKLSAPKAAFASVDFGKYYSSNFAEAGSDCWEKLYSKFPQSQTKKPVVPAPKVESSAPKMQCSAPKMEGSAPASKTMPFSEYYAANFISAPLASWDSLYAKFGKKPPAKDIKAQVAPVSSLADFGKYYKVNFAVAGEECWSSLYSKFGKKAPAGEAKMMLSAKPPAKALPAAPEVAWCIRPSVGTWLIKAPKAARAAKAEAVVPARVWNMRPSVGSWLMPAPVASPEPPAKDKAVAPKPIVREEKWSIRPSVGTWLMKPPAQKAAPKDKVAAKHSAPVPFARLPSVGTWLNAIVKAPVHKAVHNVLEAGLATHVWQSVTETILAIDHSETTKEIVVAFQTEIERKDQEIAELKRLLAMR